MLIPEQTHSRILLLSEDLVDFRGIKLDEPKNE